MVRDAHSSKTTSRQSCLSKFPSAHFIERAACISLILDVYKKKPYSAITPLHLKHLRPESASTSLTVSSFNMSSNTNVQTMASLATTLQACQQALQQLQLQQQQPVSDNTNVHTVATGVNNSPSSNQAPVGDVNSPAVSLDDDPVTTVPISTNVLANTPITNVPVVSSPITTTPITDNAVNTVAPFSNDAITATRAFGNTANVVAISDCPTTVVSFADSAVTTNVASAQAAAFLTAVTTLVQQNFANLQQGGSESSTALPAAASTPSASPVPSKVQLNEMKVNHRVVRVLQQLNALGFHDDIRNIQVLKQTNGDYYQTLNQLLADRQ